MKEKEIIENYIIIKDEQVLNDLLSKRIVRPLTSTTYSIYLNDYEFEVSLSFDDLSSKVDEHRGDSGKIVYTPKEIKNFYKEFMSSFPASDYHSRFPKTRALRTDNGNNGLVRYSRLIKEDGYTPEQIKSAMEYEVYWRKKSSTTENKMKYMQSLGPWLNNPVNIATQLELMEQDDNPSINPNTSIHDDI